MNGRRSRGIWSLGVRVPFFLIRNAIFYHIESGEGCIISGGAFFFFLIHMKQDIHLRRSVLVDICNV